MSGSITYNGEGFETFQVARTVAYVSQTDVHQAQLTVRETMDFAARCLGTGHKQMYIDQMRAREKELGIAPDPEVDALLKAEAVEGKHSSIVTDLMLRVLGLEVCADTVVGGGLLRGMSGGQRKRVTTGELMVGPAKTLLMDEISTGLDSSTTYLIVRCIRNYVHLLEGTVLMSLLQPPPEVFELFDDVMLLSEGQMVYHGPREDVVGFFAGLGFAIPERKGVADFLQEVTSRRDQPQYWAGPPEQYAFMPVEAFYAAYEASPQGKAMMAASGAPPPVPPAGLDPLVRHKYALGGLGSFKALMRRDWILMQRNWFLYAFKTAQVLFLGVLTGTLFLKGQVDTTTVANATLLLGLLFFSIVQLMFSSFTEMPLLLMSLPVFFRQRSLAMFPAWAYCLPTTILRIPVSLVESLLWSCIVYWLTGLAPDAGRFFVYLGYLLLLHQMGIALFRMMAALGRDVTRTNVFGSLAMVLLILLGGFALKRPDVHPWWIWMFWASPITYAINALAFNEMSAPRWATPLTFGGTTRTMGEWVLINSGLFTESYWRWMPALVLVGYWFLFTTITIKDAESLMVLQPDDAKAAAAGAKGLALPFRPMSVAFRDICYYVDAPGAAKSKGDKAKGGAATQLPLLHDITGAFRPGVLTALMGVSGAGKTTLMDVLAGRKTAGRVEGHVWVDGHPKEQHTFARVCGYVEQTDIHTARTTVREALVVSATLRLWETRDKALVESFVDEVLQLVELDSTRDALVGEPGEWGLSIEQRKRLTIAVELVANPSVIFMDEPTSGLDARAAAIVMRAVRNTVNTGRTVVCTIHQPSIDIIDAFDELLLLARGGRTIYHGALGCNSQQLIGYFAATPGVHAPRSGLNPATWMLDISSVGSQAALGVDFADVYAASELCTRNAQLVEQLALPQPGSTPLHFDRPYAASTWQQFDVLMRRWLQSYWRNPLYNATRFAFCMLLGVVLGTVYLWKGSKRESLNDITNIMGALFICITFLGTSNASGVQPIVAAERPVFYREVASGMYSQLPFAVAQVLVELPYVALQTLLYSGITYLLVGFELAAVKFFWYLLFTFLTLLFFTYYGMMSVAISPVLELAAIMSSSFYSVWFMFAGFFLPYSAMPAWWSWIYWLNPLSYMLYGIIASQLGDVTSTIVLGPGQATTVQLLLKDWLGFESSFVGACAGIMAGFVVAFCVAIVAAIRCLNFQRR
ncbi:ATP-binding cassette transporter [Scenedesmus sp. NREL 46B-D3]|nr:ATP-binding cassette transporter [Scenedesmus sp. NREL 46B-D3]